MTAAVPETCYVCGASPVETVLFPVAVHYKGSGFYTTDYGKGKAAKADSGGGDGGSSSGSESKSESKPAETKKPAASSD